MAFFGSDWNNYNYVIINYNDGTQQKNNGDNMSILDKMQKAGKIKYSSLMSKSDVLKKDETPTDVYAMNIVLSGRLDGGIKSGLTLFCGESMSFKTNFALMCAKAYMDKYDDAVLLFYDSEMGATEDYFTSMGIDMDKTLHIPVTDLEEFNFDIVSRIEQIERGDHVFIVFDSLGNVASKKEVEDAMNEKSAQDMSRAKKIKSIMRQIVPKLNIKDIPMLAINHVYMDISSFIAKPKMTGGEGPLLNADNVVFITKSQSKTGNELTGYNFTLNVMKSRDAKSKLKIPVTVNFDSGIQKYSGLIDLALDYGIITKPSNGWYSKVDMETGEVEQKKYRLNDTNNASFWNPILNDEGFKAWIEKQCSLSAKMLSDEEITEDFNKFVENDDE